MRVRHDWLEPRKRGKEFLTEAPSSGTEITGRFPFFSAHSAPRRFTGLAGQGLPEPCAKLLSMHSDAESKRLQLATKGMPYL